MGNNDWQDRLKIVSERQSKDSGDPLFSMWDEQRKMQAEDRKLQEELQEAKKRARELKRTLRKHQLGETNEKLITYTKTAQSQAYTGYQKLKNIFWHNKKTRMYTGIALSAVLVVGIANVVLRSNSSTGTLGDATSKIPITQDLPREKPQFELLFPRGAAADNYDVVRISPLEADASYTFLDKFSDDGVIFRVTQQEIPDNFDIAKTATDFQATSIIQVDSVTVYHGYSERGGIQSLLFEKDNKLISIRSPQKFDDDVWASYVASLQR